MVVRQHAIGTEATVRYAVKLLPFTMPEVYRLPSHTVWQRPSSADAVGNWSVRRRRHQPPTLGQANGKRDV
jgi:hypothetical protein